VGLWVFDHVAECLDLLGVVEEPGWPGKFCILVLEF
jgi:hypothetical protein